MNTIAIPEVKTTPERTAYHPKPITEKPGLIYAIVTSFKGPTGPETTHGRKYLPGEGYGFARIDGVDT